MTDREMLRFHYCHTIRHWYEPGDRAEEDEIARRYDEKFHRLWLFYLAGAMTMFTESGMVIAGSDMPAARRLLPLTCNYISRCRDRPHGHPRLT